MKSKTKNAMKSEKGVLIVEAAIVFPVMFFVLLFIIYIGNLYYEQARIDDIVTRYAIQGAQCVADPFLYDMERGEGVPADVDKLKLEPYRYILGGFSGGSISELEKKISDAVKKEVNDSSLMFFNNMKAKYVGTDNKENIAQFNNKILYSTFVVQVNYQIKFPISFMGEDSPAIFKMSARAEAPVNDTDEFIRNVDMAVDLLEKTSVGQKIGSIFDKISSFINKFAGK